MFLPITCDQPNKVLFIPAADLTTTIFVYSRLSDIVVNAFSSSSFSIFIENSLSDINIKESNRKFQELNY